MAATIKLSPAQLKALRFIVSVTLKGANCVGPIRSTGGVLVALGLAFHCDADNDRLLRATPAGIAFLG